MGNPHKDTWKLLSTRLYWPSSYPLSFLQKQRISQFSWEAALFLCQWQCLLTKMFFSSLKTPSRSSGRVMEWEWIFRGNHVFSKNILGYKSNRLKQKKNYLKKTESLLKKNKVHHINFQRIKSMNLAPKCLHWNPYMGPKWPSSLSSKPILK